MLLLTLSYTEISRSFNDFEFCWYYQIQQNSMKIVYFLMPPYIQI